MKVNLSNKVSADLKVHRFEGKARQHLTAAWRSVFFLQKKPNAKLQTVCVLNR
jgi:hypothetical protein